MTQCRGVGSPSSFPVLVIMLLALTLRASTAAGRRARAAFACSSTTSTGHARRIGGAVASSSSFATSSAAAPGSRRRPGRAPGPSTRRHSVAEAAAAVVEEVVSPPPAGPWGGLGVKEEEAEEQLNEMADKEEEGELDPALLAPPPLDQPRVVRFVIPGDPQPLRRHRVANNRMYNPSAGAQKQFLEKAKPFMPPRPLLGPLEATVVFRMKRPRSHYRSGRYAHLLKPDVPRFHTSRIDLDNLVKLVLDSLNEHAYEDDRQVVSVRAVKEYCNLGVGSTDVTLRVLEEDTIRLTVPAAAAAAGAEQVEVEVRARREHSWWWEQRRPEDEALTAAVHEHEEEEGQEGGDKPPSSRP